MKIFITILTLLSSLGLLTLQSCHHPVFVNPATAIPVINLDKNGKSKTYLIPSSVYSKKLGENLKAIDIKTSEALNDAVKKDQRWHVIQVIVGLVLSLELGLDPVYSLGIQPSVQLWFRNVDIHN